MKLVELEKLNPVDLVGRVIEVKEEVDVYDTCKDCDGKGKLTIKTLAKKEIEVECPVCKGKGEVAFKKDVVNKYFVSGVLCEWVDYRYEYLLFLKKNIDDAYHAEEHILDKDYVVFGGRIYRWDEIRNNIKCVKGFSYKCIDIEVQL